MKKNRNLYLSFAAPCLILVSIFGFFHRKDNEKVQSIPALLTGIGIVTSSFIGRNLRRKKLLVEMSNRNNDANS